MKSLNILRIGAIALFICTIVMMPQSGECGIMKIAKGVGWNVVKYGTYPVWKPADGFYQWAKETTEHGRKLQAERRTRGDNPDFEVQLSWDGVNGIWPGFIPIRGKGTWLTAVSARAPQGWVLKSAYVLLANRNGKIVKKNLKLGFKYQAGLRKTRQVQFKNRADNSTDYSWVVVGNWQRTTASIDEHWEPEWSTQYVTTSTYGYHVKYYKGRKGR